MYLGYQTFTAVPFFDPTDPDIPLTAALQGIEDAEERENYRNIVIDQERRRSINFTNVRKERKNTEKRTRTETDRQAGQTSKDLEGFRRADSDLEC